MGLICLAVRSVCARGSHFRSACCDDHPQRRCTSVNRCRTVFPSCHRGSGTLQIEGHTGRHDNCTLTRHGKKCAPCNVNHFGNLSISLLVSHSCSRPVRSPSILAHTGGSLARLRPVGRRSGRSEGRTAAAVLRRHRSCSDCSQSRHRSRMHHPGGRRFHRSWLGLLALR